MLFKSNIRISISGKYRKGDIRHNYADLTKIKSVLGFRPKIDFQNGQISLDDIQPKFVSSPQLSEAERKKLLLISEDVVDVL